MNKKERIEDIGRICEKLREVLDLDLFEQANRPGRAKDGVEWWLTKTEEQQYDFIHDLSYNIENVEFALSEIYQIARWGDDEE
jgi:hypothetical protein